MTPHRLRLPAFRLLFALAALFLWTGCEDIESKGNISDDELNGRLQAQQEDSSNAANAATSQVATRTAASPVADASYASSSSSSEESSSSDSADSADSGDSGEADDPGTPRTASSPGGSYNTSTQIDSIVWKGKNVSAWPVTTTLRASVGGGSVTLSYGKSRVWPEVDGVCANAWAIVNIDGTWYAGTFEYLRRGQTDKPSYTLDGSHGDHFKASPLSSWRPQSGEVFGLMVSGLCRGGLSNVEERSNICMVRWP